MRTLTRRELREEIFKLLFRIEFNSKDDMPKQMELFFTDLTTDDVPWGTSLAWDEKDRAYVENKYSAIVEKLESIDGAISEKATDWNIKRIGKVELTIIRLAIYEILYDEDIPTGVAIDEAVELAKKYGQEEASKFVNGVLAKFA